MSPLSVQLNAVLHLTVCFMSLSTDLLLKFDSLVVYLFIIESQFFLQSRESLENSIKI